jgi:hypothetical protein
LNIAQADAAWTPPVVTPEEVAATRFGGARSTATRSSSSRSTPRSAHSQRRSRPEAELEAQTNAQVTVAGAKAKAPPSEGAVIDLKARAAARLRRTRRRVRMPRVRQPNAVRLAYSRALLAMQAEANALVEKKLGPMLPDLVDEAGLVHDATVPRDYPEKIQRAIAQVAEEFFGRFPQDRLRAFAIGMGLRSSEAQKKDLRAQMVAIFGQSVSIDVFTEKGIPKRLSAWASANAQLITTIPSRYFDEIATRTVRLSATASARKTCSKSRSAIGTASRRAARA